MASAQEHSSGRWDRRDILWDGCQRHRSQEDMEQLQSILQGRGALGSMTSQKAPPWG